MHFVGSVGGSFLDLTDKAGMDLLIKIANTEAMRKHWDEFQEDPNPPLEHTLTDDPLKLRYEAGKLTVSEAALVGNSEDLIMMVQKG